MTADVQQPMFSVDDARRLTERIRLTAHSARESIEKLHVLVDQAKDGNAHLALGFQSWTAYLSEVLGEEPLRLARDQRQELVGYLAGEGMSTRAIAPIVGASIGQVHADKQVFRNEHLTKPEAEAFRDDEVRRYEESLEGSDPQEAARSVVAAAFAQRDEPAEPAKVTGLDGKSYMKPAPNAEPRQPNRRALPDQARDAGQELRKATERLERLMADDRFGRNKQEVAAHLRHHLNHAIKVCQDLSASFTD